MLAQVIDILRIEGRLRRIFFLIHIHLIKKRLKNVWVTNKERIRKKMIERKEKRKLKGRKERIDHFYVT